MLFKTSGLAQKGTLLDPFDGLGTEQAWCCVLLQTPLKAALGPAIPPLTVNALTGPRTLLSSGEQDALLKSDLNHSFR